MDGDINGNTKEKDSRRSYLLRIASYILGLNITEEKLRQTQPLDNFCETATNLLVFARSEQKVELWNQMKPDMKGMNRVAFYKSQSIPLTPDNYKNIVNVVTMNGASPNEVFLKSVQNVFSKNITEQASPPKQLINVVNELEENLLATVEKGQGQGVSSLPDEIKYWKSVSGSTAQQYSDAFYPLQLIIDTLENRSIEELSSLVDAYEDTCDQLWNSQPPYPEGRMKGLLISMASYLSDQTCTMIKEDEVWKDPKVEGQLRAAIAACEQWELAVKLLTGQTWRRQPDNEWKGEAVKLTMLEGFRKRLEEVLSLKLFAPQIGQLLSDKQAEKEVEKIVETTMKGTAALAYNPFTESNWRSRLMVAERAMEPLIERTIPVLKLRMQPNKRDFHNIPIDIERYRNFLCRAKIKEKLQAEREGLLTRVAEVVLAKESEINDKIAAENDGGGRFLSSIAASILFIRQQITLVESILYTTKGLLDDLPAYQKFQGHVTDLLEKCREMEREQFDNWCRETQQAIDDPADSIALETKGKIMILEQKKGTLNVNYSDRLLKLLKEVRQLASLGLTIPAKIINVTNNGEKFYRYGVTLKQIAHFYNTIDQQMLPCQQALMLDEAVAFEKLILPKKGDESTINKVTWEDPKQVEQFIQQLQEAEEKLANHNRRLRNVHSEIVQMVMDLINLDIIKDVTKWKAIITKMRSKIMEEEIVHGASKSNMKPWLIHWDRQLYKALQVQYQWGIESLQTQIPLISAQLVFMQQKLQLRPPIEEIRMKYYKEMTKFLRIPEKFKGMLDSEQTSRFFASMADRNGTRFPSIYEKAEQLIDRLCSVDEQFADWLVLAQVDLEDLIEEKFTKANDWETQFKLLKAKGREAEKIPTEIRIDCVVVNASGAKNAIEELLQRLYDTLTWTLKHSINTNLQTINQFLSQAISMLSTRPQSIDEVAEANGKHSEYAKMNKQLKGQWKVMEEQHTLLRAVAGSGLEQMSATGQEWERFEQMLDSHQEMIKEQVDVLKSNVGIRVRALNDDAAKLLAKWDQLKPKSDALQGDRETMLRAIEFIKEKRLQLNELLEQKEKLDKDCEQFDVPTQQLETLDKLAADIAQYEANWVVYEEFNTELQKLADEEWIVFRGKTYLFDEFLQQWVDKLKAGNQTHMGLRLMKDIESFKELSSCLKYCRGEVLSADHWLEMFRLLQLPKGTTIEKLKFGDLLLVGHNITANVDQLKALNARAQGEVTIREAILELEMWAAQSSFALIDYKHSNGQTMKVIKDWKESINSVKDSQALLQSLKSSPFYTQFQDKTGIWETRLADLDVYLAQMNEIQRKWIYLEPIFGRGALPSEASRFARVDSEFRAILADVAKDPRLVSLCSRQSLKRSLEQIVDQLNRCQRALNQFLEEKRSAFPRFYFLGDDDLLEILGQSTNPTVIQSHLKKLFQGINRVVFGANNETITTIVSAQGENVSLSRPVRILPQVEIWLQQLTDEMRNTLKLLTVEAVRDANPSPSKYPSQVLCLAEEIRFCSDCEQTLNGSRDLHGLKKQLQEQLKAFTNTKVEDAVLQLKLKALILDLIHHIDVVEQLITNKASSTTCWTWQRQLRFYLDKDSVVIRQVNSQFDYTYEYQGNAAKLVHTPLTDKCYLTLTQAMYMGLGGNPYGPAGTGKTESVKALASLFGRQVLVFNCDEALDVHSMSRIFVGIVQCGAWGCFDEFNRLESRVLSAISMQIQTIQNAIKNRSSTCTLGSKTASVNPNSAIFITLNPAGKGYGGRQKMPDNLKQLFRPVVMSVPDNELIAETLLYSEGFTDAAKLARKVVTVFVLSKEMLSNQQHYDWGLRALKTVLKGCGDLRAKNEEGKNEADIVVQALLLNTLSKLTFADSKRFNVLVDDIFSAPNKEMTNFGDLIEPLANAAKEMHIELTDKQLQKVFQLYEQLRQRMGVVIVGPPGSGKSTIWKVLHRALVLSGAAVRKIAFNPKAINRTKLLGNMDVDTREWQDGIITMAAREVIKDTSVHRWIVCDGDIDPEWIEALNSVLDDNRLLTMPSGERIQFGTNVNFLFETDSLQHASPATVSRMGMIFISEEDLTSKEIINHWLKQCTDSDNQDLPNWIEEYFYRALTWTESKTSLPGLTRLAIVENGLSHLRNSKTKLHFQMNLYRGLAPLVDAEKRKDLAGVVFQNTPIPDQDHPDNVYWDQRMDSLMCFTDDAGIRVKREDVEKDHTRPLILTAQAQAAKDYMTSWLEPNNRHSFLVIGPNGCGKEKLLSSCFEADSQSQVATIHCSAQSSASTILLTLLQNCVQASNANGRVLRPKDKPNLILYMKSLNLPSPDKYGTNEMLALLQQLLTYEGYYDEHLEWIGIENIQFIGSMSVQSSSTRSALPPRLFSPIRIFSVNNPSESNLNLIYSSYLTPILEPVLKSSGRVETIALSIVQLFEDLKKSFKASDRIHYDFSPRDVTKLVTSMLRYDLQEEGNIDSALVFEAERTFRDRLVNEEDRQRFDEIISNAMPHARSKNRDSIYASSGTILQGQHSVGLPMALQLRKDYTAGLQKAVNRFEFEVANISSVLTTEMCNLCMKVDRGLTCPGGSLLLAGRSGMGRRDAVRLVANLHQLPVFSPPITANFSAKQFHNELKNAIQTSISNGEHSVFLLEDYQLLDRSFLLSINSLLASGDVPGLFTTQEMDGMTAALRDSASQDAFQGHLLQYFAHRVKSLVHVVLIADIDGDEFDIRMAENPSIFKSSTVIWLDTWNRDSLIQMPKLMLTKSNIETSDDLAQACCDIQLTVPVDLAKPIKYKKFIENYARIYTTKRTAIASRLERLQAGVAKLTEAREEVAKLQKAAAKKSKLLAAKQAEADEALKAITQSMTGAEDQKVSMEQLRAETEKENERIEAQKKIIDEQLKDVEPMLKEAREAVGSIKSESLSEIRSLRAPPEAIRDILQAVLLFMGILDTSWEAMRKFLSKSGVKEEIINFDAHRISRDVHKKVSALVQSKAASFDPKNARRASVAAQPLAAWVTANLQYSTILEKISPLENEKNQLLKNLSKAEKQIEKLSKGLQTVDEKVADLKATFEVLMKEATQIKIDLDREEATIKVAATLVEKLAGEFERWQQQMGQLSEELRYVERGSLLCAAFVTYLGGVSERQRKDVVKQLKQILRQSDFDPIGFIASQTEQLNWKNDGLPADELSVQNGVVLFNDSSTPLVIDPTGRVPAFLQKHVDKAELLKAAQNDLITQIEFGLRFGKTIIVDDVIEIDPTLVPILRKDLTSIGPRQMISFAGKQIELNPEFRMFLCTRNEQIRMPICTRSLLSEVNFTTTKSGLSSQLLGLAIQLEKPELEERSSALARDSESKKLELEKLEQLLLQQLASSEGNLLENTSLLDSLNKSKENAETIGKSIQESEQLRAQLAEQRNAYLSLAEFASSLYFAFSDLHRYNHMYNYNVNLIISLFTNTIQNCTDSTSTRIDTLCRTLQLKVFYTISRSLFKADRLTFALNFIHETMPKMFAKNEWELLTGIMVDENMDTSATMRSISWVEDSRATAIAKLQSHLPSLYNTLQLNDLGTWTEFSKSVECENSIPNSIVNKITPFQTVLLIQAVRPDRLYAAMQQFVLKILSISSVNPPPFSLADVFDESSSAQPILLLLAGGADPSQELVELAASKGHRLESISMGQGQETAAAEAIRRATAEGFWLCLGNVHLMLSIVPVIQKELALAQIHKDFRLWLTAEADNHFSPIMLQQCMKVTFEPPPGIKNNMLRTYGQIEEAKRTALTCQSIFVLAWMHALLQERRTYIPQAWTKFYEFSNADVRMARVLIEQLTGQGGTDWEFIRGLLQFVIYGGRIESQFDSNVLVSYLNTLFNGQKITGQRGQQVASGIEIITADNIKEFVNHTAKSIPDEDEPALFGLPANIRFSWQLTEAEETVTRMRNAAGSKSAIDRKQLADAANPLLQLWKKLCQGSDLHNRALPTPKESTDPIVEVLSLEWVHAVQIVQSIHGSLSSISRCIRGASIPDRVTLQSMESLLLHQCPDEWSNYWAGPRESAEYLNAVIFKAKSTQEILSASEKGDFLQNPVNLSMLFRPTTLLNALRQATARKMSKALDELRLVSSWDNRPQAGAVLSMQVKGIQLQGALFDGLLRETSSSSPPTTVAPPLALSWMPLDSSPASSSDSVLVPLYSDSDRQSLIAPVTMPCRNPDQWNIAAVALFLK